MLCSFLQTISSKPEVCNLGWFSPKWQLAMSGDRFDCQRWGKEYLRPWVDGGPGCCKASYNEQDDPLHGPQTCHDKRAFITQWSSEPCRAGPPKSDGSQRRVLAKRGPLEEGRAAHSSILALRNLWTVWKGREIWHQKTSPPGQRVSSMTLGKSGGYLLLAPERMKQRSRVELMLRCGCVWCWE